MDHESQDSFYWQVSLASVLVHVAMGCSAGAVGNNQLVWVPALSCEGAAGTDPENFHGRWLMGWLSTVNHTGAKRVAGQ